MSTACFWSMLSGDIAPNWRYTTVPKVIVSGLRDLGVSQSDIDTMTRHNPRRLLETVSAGIY
jgi:predicted metal-dependent phosphotriesterase family hydrolase